MDALIKCPREIGMMESVIPTRSQYPDSKRNDATTHNAAQPVAKSDATSGGFNLADSQTFLD